MQRPSPSSKRPLGAEAASATCRSGVKDNWEDLGEGCYVGYFPRYLTPGNPTVCLAGDLMPVLMGSLVWRQRSVRLGGKAIPQPRLVAYYSIEPLTPYTYSGLTLEPEHFPGDLLHVKGLMEKLLGPGAVRLTACLANLYRDGNDHVSWHADDEPVFGPEPTIVSVSLGATREFVLRHNHNPNRQIRYQLADGDVLVMKGHVQTYWKHSLLRSPTCSSPRINLTYRTLYPHAAQRKLRETQQHQLQQQQQQQQREQQQTLEGALFPELSASTPKQAPLLVPRSLRVIAQTCAAPPAVCATRPQDSQRSSQLAVPPPSAAQDLPSQRPPSVAVGQSQHTPVTAGNRPPQQAPSRAQVPAGDNADGGQARPRTASVTQPKQRSPSPLPTSTIQPPQLTPSPPPPSTNPQSGQEWSPTTSAQPSQQSPSRPPPPADGQTRSDAAQPSQPPTGPQSCPRGLGRGEASSPPPQLPARFSPRPTLLGIQNMQRFLPQPSTVPGGSSPSRTVGTPSPVSTDPTAAEQSPIETSSSEARSRSDSVPITPSNDVGQVHGTHQPPHTSQMLVASVAAAGARQQLQAPQHTQQQQQQQQRQALHPHLQLRQGQQQQQQRPAPASILVTAGVAVAALQQQPPPEQRRAAPYSAPEGAPLQRGPSPSVSPSPSLPRSQQQQQQQQQPQSDSKPPAPVPGAHDLPQRMRGPAPIPPPPTAPGSDTESHGIASPSPCRPCATGSHSGMRGPAPADGDLEHNTATLGSVSSTVPHTASSPLHASDGDVQPPSCPAIPPAQRPSQQPDDTQPDERPPPRSATPQTQPPQPPQPALPPPDWPRLGSVSIPSNAQAPATHRPPTGLRQPPQPGVHTQAPSRAGVEHQPPPPQPPHQHEPPCVVQALGGGDPPAPPSTPSSSRLGGDVRAEQRASRQASPTGGTAPEGPNTTTNTTTTMKPPAPSQPPTPPHSTAAAASPPQRPASRVSGTSSPSPLGPNTSSPHASFPSQPTAPPHGSAVSHIQHLLRSLPLHRRSSSGGSSVMSHTRTGSGGSSVMSHTRTGSGDFLGVNPPRHSTPVSSAVGASGKGVGAVPLPAVFGSTGGPGDDQAATHAAGRSTADPAQAPALARTASMRFGGGGYGGSVSLTAEYGQEGVHVLLRKYEIILGRYSKGAPVDVVLGETMNISRQHGKIVYNFVTKCFDLVVLSKNGISVNHTLFTPQSLPQPLHSRDLLQVGDKSFHFLLPRVRRASPHPAQHTAGTNSSAQPSHPQAQHSSGGHLRDAAGEQPGGGAETGQGGHG
ncbi:MAG: hypothetical protein WDW36_009287 [Sanguina aurantia]